MKDKSTHFIFDGNKIVISPDLFLTVNFLQEIGKEIDTSLGFDKKLESITKRYLETLELIGLLAKKLKDNSIDFNHTLSERPETMADILKLDNPVRSKLIILFAYLETLMRLNFAYENKICDREKIRKQTFDQVVWESFYRDFCLNINNQWGQKNQERLKNITVQELRYLRNSLTHFFSLDIGLLVADAFLNEKSRKLEQITNFELKFISPEDLHEIIKGAAMLMIEKWSNDYKECLKTNSNEFTEKILAMNTLIESAGVITVKNEQVNI